MPVYNDPQTLSVEGQTIYNAVHAPGAYTHNIRLKWTSMLVEAYDTEKVLFEVYDAVDEEFMPPAYPENGYLDLVINGRVKKRIKILPSFPYEEDATVLVSAIEINAKLAQMNSWMLENADLVAHWIHP